MSDAPVDLSKRFIARPINARRFHVFDLDFRSLCKKWMMPRPDPHSCVNVNGDERANGEDCAACFRRAGLMVSPL